MNVPAWPDWYSLSGETRHEQVIMLFFTFQAPGLNQNHLQAFNQIKHNARSTTPPTASPTSLPFDFLAGI